MPVRKRKNEVVTIEGQHGRQDNPFTARRSIRRVGVALLVLVGGGGAVGTPLVGQDPPAVLTGRVFDQAGPVLAADVSLLRGTEVVARAVSDDRGAFRIEAPVGGFTLKAERLGYAALSRLVTLQPGVVTDVDIELQPATDSEARWFRKVVSEFEDATEASAFPPSPSQRCSGCEYRNSCREDV